MGLLKKKGGLGFRDLFGFNIALLGKHCWNFMSNPMSLVSRLFKAKYFPSTHVLNVNKGQGASFIWNGIWTAKEELKKGFRWVLGSGDDIVATKDQWLRSKRDFSVEQSHIYEGRTELVSSLFNDNSKSWNVGLVNSLFEEVDAAAILATSIPQCEVKDRVAWTVMTRLHSKGITLPLGCPMCDHNSENLLHLFFECVFAVECWRQVNLVYDLLEVTDVSGWLLDKLNEGPTEELVKLCTVLWGVWFWRNKKVWSDKTVTAAFAMEESCRSISSWREARKTVTASNVGGGVKLVNRWIPPEAGAFKINVDVSVRDGVGTFSVGMVLRDQEGGFIAGKTHSMRAPGSVFEAEAIGVREALSWVKDQHLQNICKIRESTLNQTLNSRFEQFRVEMRIIRRWGW
ncbi:uncharacterized protein LOC141715185 [Apium graveolens]|uniref:uncharacterized protein LOC141715185 n=1 Tax=Apium graveolens TaxID=4045 RepID=UPI003D7AAD10